ncbi:hypothetical protein DSO57_1014782 [Entomophthora muscae]|uniref:Uncharacterized protein n=1 Tax=Entomophthora muscae TaxID=34485 RepID=A0ACC2UEX0_9FUNG|nr:hypothetical protein DSO57_1014782 [Entomophthora muscae]
MTPDDPKNSDPTAKTAKGSSSQVQNVIVNQSLTKVEMPQMGKLTLKEACRTMPVLQLHFQANAPSVTVGSSMLGIICPSKKA